MTETILSHIEAEWSDSPNPLMDFVASQSSDVLSKIHSMNPDKSDGVGSESDKTFFVQLLRDYAEINKGIIQQKKELQKEDEKVEHQHENEEEELEREEPEEDGEKHEIGKKRSQKEISPNEDDGVEEVKKIVEKENEIEKGVKIPIKKRNKKDSSLKTEL